MKNVSIVENVCHSFRGNVGDETWNLSNVLHKQVSQFFKFYFFDKKSRIGDALLINFEQIVSFFYSNIN